MHAYKWRCRRLDDANAEVVVDVMEDAMPSKAESMEALRSEEHEVDRSNGDEVEGHDEVLVNV
jgi:hypothetical protein